MTDLIESLDELLRVLGQERSLRGRLRVLGRSWNLLKELTPEQRERVALRMGSDWAWKRLEKNFLADGELSESERLVGRVLGRMGRSDSGELRRLAKMVRGGDRGGAKDLLMQTLDEALREEADREDAAQRAPSREEDRIAEPGVEPEPRDEGEPTQGVETVAGVLASTRAEPVSQRHATPPPPHREPPARPEPPPPAPRASAGLPDPPPQQMVLPEPFDVAGLSGLECLRVLGLLNRAARPGAELERMGRARLVESLGGGWASRRALSRMIEARSIDDLDEALALIGRLQRPMQRTWCLADLLESWPLGEDERSRVLDAAPTDAARRRLSHRSGPRAAAPR